MTDSSQEVERKFLVAEMPPLDGAVSEHIRQGYFTVPEDSVQVRLRQKGARFFLTVKGQGTLSRSEHETEIPAEVFERLWPATGARRLEKIRWTGRLPGGEVFELDLFEDRDLRLVEVEFADETGALEKLRLRAFQRCIGQILNRDTRGTAKRQKHRKTGKRATISIEMVPI